MKKSVSDKRPVLFLKARPRVQPVFWAFPSQSSHWVYAILSLLGDWALLF